MRNISIGVKLLRNNLKIKKVIQCTGATKESIRYEI